MDDPYIYVDSEGDFYFQVKDIDNPTFRFYCLTNKVVLTECNNLDITLDFIKEEELVTVHGYLLNHLLLLARRLIVKGIEEEQLDNFICEYLATLSEE